MANLEYERGVQTTDDSGFEPMGSSMVERARGKVDDARAALADADRKVRGFVLEHPLASLVGALAVGYAVGRLLRKL
jgi:hypothetical protein